MAPARAAVSMAGRVEKRMEPSAVPEASSAGEPSASYAPVVDDDHLVGQALGLGQLVGGEDHADPRGPAGRR